LAAGAVAALKSPSVRAQAPERITSASLATGVSVIINEFMAAKRFDLKHGVDIAVTQTFTAVNNYYTDLAAGSFDMGTGSWDVFATMYQRGVPVKLVCLATSGNMINIVSGNNGPKDIESLKGKTIAAVQATGSFAICKAVLQDRTKIELGKDVTVQNVPSPAQAITLVAAGTTDAGLSWEPNVSIGMAQIPGLKSIFNAGEAYQQMKGQVLPYFSFAVRSDRLNRTPDLGKRLSAAFRDCIAGIIASPDEAIAVSAAKMQVAPAIIRDALSSKRLDFRADSMTDPAGRKLVADAFSYMQSRGSLQGKALGDDFFA
jgi:NitT/TauT family transport system substrate-binding protein